ncbi:MAG: amidohydrolase family protein [Oscillospiraceae bacterium]|nr:amidohydrolase family protein [Oscillospiraceae bacterium]
MFAFINATLIDGTGAAPRHGMRVLCRGEKIAAVGRYILLPEDAHVIDLKGRVLMPGLIDAHSHLGDHPYKDRPGIDSAQSSDFYAQMRHMTLKAGVTSIRSCGDYMDDTALLRDKTAAGELVGPSVFCSGKSFMRRDSHPATTVWAGDPATVENCGAYPQMPAQAREMVRQAVRAKMDFIKIIISDIHISYWPKRVEPLSEDIIQAIIDEAHKSGLPVACHVDNLEQALLAVRNGADEIHHLTNMGSRHYELDEYGPLFEKMCVRNIWLVPTVTAPRAFERARIDRGCLDSPLDYQLNVLRRAYEYGVNFGLGCDSGCPGVPWGECVWDELREYVYNIGMTPLEAIRCATVNNARILGRENALGVVHAGALADLLVLEKNPVEDIGNLDSVYLVLHEGKIVTDNRR